MEIYEEKLGADDANVAKTKNNLVNKQCFLVLSFYVLVILSYIFCRCCSPYFISFQVEKHYRRALEIYENKYGVADPNVAKTVTNLVCLSFIIK